MMKNKWCGAARMFGMMVLGLCCHTTIFADQRFDRAGWKVQIIADAGGLTDDDNYLGQLSAASDGLDDFDIEEARPYRRDYLSVLFANHQLPRAEWGYSSDFRATTFKPTGQWPFVVRSSVGDEYITLSWSGNQRILHSGWLIDLETGSYISTAPGSSYSYRVDKKERQFIFAILTR